MAGVSKSLFVGLHNAMSSPSSAGKRSAGLRSKKTIEEKRTLVFVDESGFYLLPAVLRTYAPVAKTPIIREYLTHDHLSVISGVSPEGKLYMMVQERAYKSPDVVNFLRHLLRHVPGKLLVLWDGAPIHRGQVVKEYLANGASERIHLERLPAYAPELNPDEGIWKHLKRVELKNVSCQDMSHLRSHFRRAKERLRHKTHIILSCIKQPGFL